MALNFAQLFGDLGKIIKTVDEFQLAAVGGGSSQPDIPDLQAEIEAQLIASGRNDMLDGLQGSFVAHRNAVAGIAQSITQLATQRLTHRESVIEELPGVTDGADVQDVLEEIGRAMIDNSESINESSVTIGTITADGGNQGNGTVYATKKLNTINNPASLGSTKPWYAGLDSELAVPTELMSLTCTGDEGTSSLAVGSERFTWEGQPGPQQPWGWRSEGSATRVTLQTANSNTLVSGGEFETFASDLPASWAATTGAAGTEFEENTAAPYRGAACLQLNGTGTDTDLRQASPRLVAGQRYLIALAYKDGGSGSGDLHFGFHSPSGEYTPSGDFVDIDSSAITAASSWTVATAEFVAPTNTIDDMQIRLHWSTTSGTVLVDSAIIAPISTYANGIGLTILAGPTQFAIGDRFTWTVSNTEGLFQRFFRRAYGVQMPSSSSPTRADSLAT